nr:MAG TPA: hypothetical protein [Bacteriophage sp.]
MVYYLQDLFLLNQYYQEKLSFFQVFEMLFL